MPVQVTKSSDGHQLAIKITERFDYSVQQAFRNAYKEAEKEVTFIVDLSGADYIDSAALGMLLLLKKYAQNKSEQVIIYKPSPSIKKVLDVSKFDKLFTIEA